jgi:DNA-binding beta-propeller fold protein YncE
MIKICLLLGLMPVSAFGQQYSVTGSVPLSGKGAWDYLRVDADAGRLYVSHSNEVDVIDLKTERPIGKLAGFGFIHGIVLVPGQDLGFLSDGNKNEVVRFDPRTLQVVGRTEVQPKPNSMVYDTSSRRLFVGHKPSDSMTVLSAEGKIEKTIELGGEPEFPVADGSGSVFVNLEDKSEIVRIDAHTLQVTAHWPLAPCKGPSGLAISMASRRLFSACDNKVMAIVDADTGRVVATEPIGKGPDAAAYDALRKLALSSNEDGTLTVIADKGGDRYAVVQNLATEKGARTMALDPQTHAIYLSAAKLGPPPQPTAADPHPVSHPTAVPGTFHVIVVKPIRAAKP